MVYIGVSTVWTQVNLHVCVCVYTCMHVCAKCTSICTGGGGDVCVCMFTIHVSEYDYRVLLYDHVHVLVGSGITVGLVGVGYFAKIHHLYYFIIVQVFGGVLQVCLLARGFAMKEQQP